MDEIRIKSMFFNLTETLETHLNDTYKEILIGKPYQSYYINTVNILLDLIEYANLYGSMEFDKKATKLYYDKHIETFKDI